MIKQDAFSPARRKAGALALALLCAGGGAAAWAARPAETVIVPVQDIAAPIPRAGTTNDRTAPVATGEPQRDEALPILPPQVNLSNAGGEAARFPVRDAAAVQAAIEAGDVKAVMAAGATPKDLGDTLRTSCNGLNYAVCNLFGRVQPGSERYFRQGPDGDGDDMRLAVGGLDADGNLWAVSVHDMDIDIDPPGTEPLPGAARVALGFPAPATCAGGSRDVRCGNVGR